MNRAPGGFRKRHPWWVLGRARYRYKLAPRVVRGCGRGQSPRKENPMGRRTEVETIKKDTMNCGEWAGPATKKESLGSKSPWEATPALFSVGSSTPQETHSA